MWRNVWEWTGALTWERTAIWDSDNNMGHGGNVLCILYVLCQIISFLQWINIAVLYLGRQDHTNLKNWRDWTHWEPPQLTERNESLHVNGEDLRLGFEFGPSLGGLLHTALVQPGLRAGALVLQNSHFFIRLASSRVSTELLTGTGMLEVMVEGDCI